MKNIILAFSFLVVFITCHAEEVEDDRFQWNGFASQSWVKSSQGTHISGNSDATYGSLLRSEIGVQASYQASTNIDVRGMASVIQDGHIDSRLRVNYGVIDIHQDDGLTGVRVGRFIYDFGFYNAARNNPSYRDLEIPPQALYRDSLKYMSRSGDGVQVYKTIHLDDNYTLDIDAGYSKPILYPQNDIVQAFVSDKAAGTMTGDSRIAAFNATLADRARGLVFKYDYMVMDYSLNSSISGDSINYPIRTKTHYIGARKYFDFGDVTLEMMIPKIMKDKWDQAAPSYENYSVKRAYNITYKHYLTSKASLIIGYDHAQGTPSNAPIPGMVYHSSYNLGVKYRTLNWTFKVEGHRVNGNVSLPVEGNDYSSPSQPGSYNLFLATVTYSFK